MRVLRRDSTGSVLAVAGLVAAMAFAVPAEVCEFQIETCVEDLDGQVFRMPTDVMAMSANVLTCTPTEIGEDVVDSSSPPAIFFLIDHSHSMMGLGRTYPGNDPYGSRFEVVRDLLDTIYAAYPNAEVGMAVFREVLYFDHRNEGLFVPLVGQGDQSYLPLLELQSRVSGNRTAIEEIRRILQTDTVITYNALNDVNVEHADLVYEPQFSTIGNTNINVAFDAAKEAFTLTDIPPDRQYIIFLSDGEPFPTTEPHAGKDPFYFQEANNIPTTFTVYFTDDGVAPASLISLTDNARANGYSTTNPSSALWTLQTTYDDLMGLLMDRVVRPILTVVIATPNSVTINGLTSTTHSDTSFLFNDRFELNADTTLFDFAIDYTITRQSDNYTFDSTYAYSFTVVRDESVGSLSPDFSLNCWDEVDLGLYWNGAPQTTINQLMDTLQVVLDPRGVDYGAIDVTLSHVTGTPIDAELVSLTFVDSVWVATFTHLIDSNRTSGDGILQHDVFDSIVVVYRNPGLALDTVRLSVPFMVTNSVALRTVTYLDCNADGYVDSLYLAVDGDLDSTEVEAFLGYVTLPAVRGFTIDNTSIELTSGGVGVRVGESTQHAPATGILDGDTVVVGSGRLDLSGWVMPVTVVPDDKVAPVILYAHLVAHENAVDPDTLTVVFSEDMAHITSVEPFLYYSMAEAMDYTATLDINNAYHNADTLIVAVPYGQVDNEAERIVRGDSIWISSGAFVQDVVGNRQNDPDNRRVQVTVTLKRDPYELVPQVANNPLTLDDPDASIPAFLMEIDEIREELTNSNYGPGSSGGTGQRGVVVMAEPGDEMRVGANFSLSGKISIFDIVNNPVVIDRPMGFDNDPSRPKRLYYVWDGRNRLGRYVGTGTYLAVMTIKDDQGYKETKTVRLGVKR